MRTFPKDNRYSVYTGNNDTTTPTSTRKSFAYLRKKFNSGRNSSYLDTEGYSRSRRSSIGATIPSALELRDRCQSEGNLLLVSPNNVEDNQATIVSLPQSVITDFVGTSFISSFFVYFSMCFIDFLKVSFYAQYQLNILSTSYNSIKPTESICGTRKYPSCSFRLLLHPVTVFSCVCYRCKSR